MFRVVLVAVLMTASGGGSAQVPNTERELVDALQSHPRNASKRAGMARGTVGPGSDWFDHLEKNSSYARKMNKAATRELQEIRKARRSLMDELGKAEPTTPSSVRVRRR
jgi:hypothetical protein